MAREFISQTEFRKLGADPRTAVRRYKIKPFGIVKVGSRWFNIYEPGVIDQIRQEQLKEQN